MITIIAVGKKHEPWITDGVERYQKRLKAPWNMRWELLPHSALEGPEARQNESQAILHKLSASDYVILLDERGKLLDSPALSAHLQQQFVNARNVVLAIGGAYGVNDELMQRANFTWSLSPLVFPHQLIRLLLAEQLYRAQEIAAGHPYHHQ